MIGKMLIIYIILSISAVVLIPFIATNISCADRMDFVGGDEYEVLWIGIDSHCMVDGKWTPRGSTIYKLSRGE